ncbi:hypothetical protein E4U60_006327 [Claviceps pazoutovae]|uniref:Uncharacterized protein n=1 Tax=Claviceps pazoutovae TaxID=1649127 RepID=A0A9P7M719_9HYPO|nr:hypothetical protein E4U60_006327 [Claviceps pazoutovae]
MGPSPQPQSRTEKVVGHPARTSKFLLKSRVLDADEGARDWVEIFSFVGSRSAKQCRERWHQVLDHQLNHDPITWEEGDFILKWVARKGQQWAEITRQLRGRSDNAVKNWYNGVQKKSKRRESALELQRQNASQREDSHQVPLPVPNLARPLPSVECPSLPRHSAHARLPKDWHLSRLLSPSGSDLGESGENLSYTTSPAAEWPRSPVIPHSQEPPRQGQCVWYKRGLTMDRCTGAAATHSGGTQEKSEFAAEGL